MKYHLLVIYKVILILTMGFPALIAVSQVRSSTDAIYSGVPWFDQNGEVVSAHGANIICEDEKFYLFGEYKSDTSNAFTGFSCYSSTDLYNWKFEGLALSVQDSGRLGPGRVGERPKVMKCLQTGEFIMLMHTDDLSYKDPVVGYATSMNITGPYEFQGPILYQDKPIRKWDMGAFQDSDGKGYLITHSGNLFRLSADYKRVEEQVVKDMTPQCESPLIFKKNGTYFWMGSHLTSWERNDNYYFTADTLSGPWTSQGTVAPEGTLTWNSQSSFVLTVPGTKDTTFMYMGDRWAFPRQYSAATYVWQPLEVCGDEMALPTYHQAWTIDIRSGTSSPFAMEADSIEESNQVINYSGNWESSLLNDTLSLFRSDKKGDHFSFTFGGNRIGFYGVAAPDGGFAHVTLSNQKGDVVLVSTIDMYSKYPERALRFISPVLEKDKYTFTITVAGAHGTWTDKKKNIYGSMDDFVSLDAIVFQE